MGNNDSHTSATRKEQPIKKLLPSPIAALRYLAPRLGYTTWLHSNPTSHIQLGCLSKQVHTENTESSENSRGDSGDL